MKASRVVTVFGSSQAEEDGPEYLRALELGQKLAAEGFVVCSGGHKGIMEAVSRGAKKGGGKTIGILSPEFGGRPNAWIDEVRTGGSWRDRLFQLIDSGDAYVYFDGGTGTWTELFVSWEMMSKKLLRMKPMVVGGEFLSSVVLNLKGHRGFSFHDLLFFAHDSDSVMHAVKEGFSRYREIS